MRVKKLFLKLRKFIIPIALLMIWAPGVYALTNADIVSIVENFRNTRCSADSLSEQDAINCYLLEHGQTVVERELMVFDANNQELGALVDYNTFFVPSIQRLVSVDLTTGQLLRLNQAGGYVYYTQENCTGDAYIVYATESTTEIINTIYLGFDNSFYTVDNFQPESVMVHSRFKGDICDDGNLLQSNIWKLRRITLPFSSPVALPLRYGYE